MAWECTFSFAHFGRGPSEYRVSWGGREEVFDKLCVDQFGYVSGYSVWVFSSDLLERVSVS